MSKPHLYSYQACPFARRTRMALLEKGIDFELTEIDINNKPANFEQISPYGKVPVLLHEDTRLYESAIINEYLDEYFPEPSLMPSDPALRAQARIWMDYCNTRFSAASWKHMRSINKGGKTQATALEELQQCLYFMEAEGLAKLSDGPWWLGHSISLVDIQFIPFMQRFLDNGRAEIPADCTRLHRWLDIASQHPSFLATAG
jgi:glutathione S-transferase